MANDRMETPELLGALVGWLRFRSRNGNIVRLQCAKSLEDAKGGSIRHYDMALNARQLRAFAHDLVLAADELEGKAQDRGKRWWNL